MPTYSMEGTATSGENVISVLQKRGESEEKKNSEGLISISNRERGGSLESQFR